ncbi:transmembrane protein 68 [Eurytemora carolleeae]|uniref:transmembrane protein 68 n=1 Tax=Eurytemora carolleeae TaxID=1294199 RepID=UPI000C781408|nr:transmembrane protein 68 [Eurytemora carolleeae]|eukprot:XP_023347043.1 transmembrane protein 68-like [Eurytemora affinis]
METKKRVTGFTFINFVKDFFFLFLGVSKLLTKSIFFVVTCSWRFVVNQQYSRALPFIGNLTKEIVLCILFVFGPYTLLGVVFSAAGIVAIFCFVAKTLNRDQGIALDIGLHVAATFIRILFKIWHGQEFQGLSNIPTSGSALIVWYHGPMPVDYLALIAEVQYQYGRNIKSIIDRCLKMLPWSWFFINKLGCTCDGPEFCVDQLKAGQLMGVAPGGSREALFGEEFSLQWGKRTGFARIAIEANVPIIPLYTENISVAYATMKSFRPVWRYIFEATRLPIIPIWGGFPVKLTTHIGVPIYPVPNETPETLREKTKAALQEMMAVHQSKNMTVAKGIYRRFVSKPQIEKAFVV